jgi:hypothetical protein
MRKTLGERFMESKGEPLDVDGQTVIAMYQRTVNQGQRVSFRAKVGVTAPVQGVCLKLSKGLIRINRQDLKDVVLWLDTAPELLEFSCHPKGRLPVDLKVWNCWRDEIGTTQAWIGNSGMIADEAGDRVTLQCSPGAGEFDPSRLTVELSFH